MIAAPALPCPKCKRALGPESWIDANNGVCFRCETEFEFFPLPALHAAPRQVAPQAAVPEADSVCFFHAENRAEAFCESCGRMLCAVCAVPFSGQKLCPTCIAASRTSKEPTAVRSRVLYGGSALAVALLPPLSIIFFFLTPLTAPIALGLVIYGWNKPGSIVRPGRIKLIIAGIAALLQIGWWVFLAASVWLN